MLSKLNTQAFQPAVKQINTASQKGLPHLVTGLDASARSVMIAELYRQRPQQLLIVEPSATLLTQLYEDLLQLLPGVKVLQFTAEESLALEFSHASLDSVAQRVVALDSLASGENCIVLTSVAGIRKRLTPVDKWCYEMTRLSVGSEMERTALEQKLSYFGYTRQAMVQAPGEYSVRGSIVDVYPLNTDYPVRLDFFDTELDSIRYFDAETQTSIENIEQFDLLPAKDVLFSIAEQQIAFKSVESHLAKVVEQIEDDEFANLVQRGMQHQRELLASGEPLKFPLAYLEFWDKEDTSLVDYLGSNSLLVINEFSKIHQTELQYTNDDMYWLEQEITHGQLPPKLNIRLSAFEVLKHSQVARVHFVMIQKNMGNMAFESMHSFHYRSMNPFFNQMPLIKTEVDHWFKQKVTVQILVSSHKQAVKTQQLFEEYNVKPTVIQEGEEAQVNAVNIVVGSLANGFELPLDKWVVLTEKELFNQVKKRKIKHQHLSNAERIKSYSELNIGDYVVHASHGIGQYTGLDTIEINGVHRDLLAIEYQNNARVLIPVDQIDMIKKYVSAESRTPKVHKLGGTDWAKTKKKVASKIEDIADELIALYAKREQEEGYAFGKDTPEQAEFENAFAYVETDDQLRSATEIKKDMERIRPMDRLLVGDVGYGKTEVAMRAIFKAVMEGKQVAFLVPTTILAQQHYNSLIERFAEYPFEVGMLSRFVTRSKQNETIKGLENGAVNIVVGTHRVLSKDIKFQDLGLLIVDEEQRFGVRHKERLKQLKAQVDVLTLTATPIPRTLHMSMIGVRDLSLIETPPSNRYPVQTYVMERNDGVILSGIEREMARGGQVFYLHNRVATIFQRAEEIRQLVPEARIGVAHGQMSEVELENVLIDFIQGNYDVLVTTTIIETGVDIPNANTMFIDNADQMGLSTLYQLRGRVGRTNRIAYAYLMYDPFKQLSEVSEKRLQAIREFTELGSGFKIAMRDLSIRGAGNLLGKQQSGFIDSVGFDMYSQMLKEAVDVKRGKKSASKQTSSSQQMEWDIAVDAYIPSSYISDELQKISVYKSIQQIDSEEEYRNLQNQLIDRFGEFPGEVADLLDIALIKHFGLLSGVTLIKQQGQYVNVYFNPIASDILKGPKIFEALQDIKLRAEIGMEDQQLKVSLLIQGKPSYQWLDILRHFIVNTSEMIAAEENIIEKVES